MRKIALHIILLFCSASVFAQHLSSTVNKAEIKIGEPFTLTYRITSNTPLKNIHYTPQKKQFNAIVSKGSKEKTDTLFPLDLLVPFSDTTVKDSNQYIWKGQYKLTGWDSAYVVLPPDSIQIAGKTYFFAPQLVQITSPKVIKGKPIYDIHAQFTTSPNQNIFIQFMKKYGWWIALLGIGLAIGLYSIIKKRRRRVKPVVQKSLLEQTLSKIDALEEKKGYEKNLKEYYFELSLILRWFLAQYYKKEFLEKTTREIQLQLKNESLSHSTIITIRNLLLQSDGVKFAREKPQLSEILSVTNTAREIVHKIVEQPISSADE